MRSTLLFTFTLLAAFLLASCFTSPTSSIAEVQKQSALATGGDGQGPKDNAITLDYPTEIEGYRVRVYWKPVRIKYSYVIGPAILEFSNAKDSTSFTLTSNHFSVLKTTLNFDYNEDSHSYMLFQPVGGRVGLSWVAPEQAADRQLAGEGDDGVVSPAQVLQGQIPVHCVLQRGLRDVFGGMGYARQA